MHGASIRGYDNRDRRFFACLSGFRKGNWNGGKLEVPPVRMTFLPAQP